MDLSYILNEYAEDREEYFRAIAPPIIQTSNFAFKKVDDLRKSFADEYATWLYSRGLNPTVEILRKKLATLDGAEDCLVFNSGASAIFCSVLANVKSGDHIVSVRHPYTWAKKMFNEILPRFNVNTTYIDGRDVENFKAATRPNTTLYYLESPNSWMFELQDLKEVAALAKEKNIVTICDNSYCTPLYQKPIELGIDLVLQSATKYIGGHSDTVAGVLSGGRKMIERIFNSEYMNTGSGIMPFNAWLLIRGLRTLPLRLERITNTTNKVVEYLKQHPLVEKVIFPFDKDFPQYELAKKQMKGACGLLSFVMKVKNIGTIETFCESLRHILMAVSWGGHESLIIPGCASIKPEKFSASNQEHRMLRLYCGLEEADYIITDLEQAFNAIKNK
jgi:cystathionine beta-lyase/cystathionine gamma-synthase